MTSETYESQIIALHNNAQKLNESVFLNCRTHPLATRRGATGAPNSPFDTPALAKGAMGHIPHLIGAQRIGSSSGRFCAGGREIGGHCGGSRSCGIAVMSAGS